MAPEVFGQRASRTTVPAQPPVSLTCSVDIYALGVVLWELLARQLPWDGLHGMMVAYSVSQGERPSALPPPLPTELAQQPGAAAIHAALWTPEVCQLIADCWHQDWRQRPLAPQVMARLNSIMDGLPDTGAANPQVPITLEGGTLESRLHTVV